MASSKSRENPTTQRGLVGSLLWGLYRLLASLQLAVVLIVALVAVLCYATWYESVWGTDWAQWYIYDSIWFIALAGLLAVNILAATAVRFPWGRRRIGFVVTHVGLLMLLGGSIQTFIQGVEGRVTILEDETVDNMALDGQSQFVVSQPRVAKPVRFTFEPGAVDWKPGRTLDFGASKKGVRLKVLKFYRHARFAGGWVEDRENHEASAIQFNLFHADGAAIGSAWLVAEDGPGVGNYRMLRATLYPAPMNSMRDDFIAPPTAEEMEEKGVLSVHHNGQMQRLSVDQSLGKKTAVGDTGVSIEITKQADDFSPETEPAVDPIVVLLVHLPGQDEPVEHVVMARRPLDKLKELHQRPLPVAFWYHHPRVAAVAGLELLQTPDEKLYARSLNLGVRKSHGQVKPREPIRLASGLVVRIEKHLPRARYDMSFESVKRKRREKGGPAAAALVEVRTDDVSQQVWVLRNERNDPGAPLGQIDTPYGPLTIAFEPAMQPLGFSLKLLDFTRKLNPGGYGNAAYTSTVQLLDEKQGIDQKHVISMNHTLTHGRFTFYQSSYADSPGGKASTTLQVTYDPGRFLKYSGSLMLCVGIFIMYYMKKRRSKKSS